MKKKILTIIGVILVILVTTVIIAVFNDDSRKDDAYNIAAEGLDVEFNADIMVYGENPKFRDTVKYRMIKEISEETLNYEEKHGYRAIVLFDRSGTIDVSDEELLLVKSYVEEKGYDMIYIGENYLDDFERLGFTVGCREEAFSLEYIGSIHEGKEVQQNEVGNLYAQHGLWYKDEEKKWKEDNNKIQSRIITIMYDYAREAAGVEF